MKQNQNIINLNQTRADKAYIGGGKFAGLAQIKPLLQKYTQQYGVELDLPQTYAITTEAFEKYDIARKGVPEEIVNQAMHCLVACGGNVAVRSSADVEDKGGTTHSGEFASVLSIKNRRQMRAALETVYTSAQNIPGAKMGVIIQPMIEMPQMAGVIYSQDFNGDPLVVINWTQGKPANYLLVNEEQGNITKVSKYCDTEESLKLFEFGDIDTQNADPRLHTVCDDNSMGTLNVSAMKDLNINYIASLVALANHLEKDLNHPVDIEFAITESGRISVLQQRPYIMNNKYVVKQFENGDWAGYQKDSPVIAGEVKLVDIRRTKEYEKALNNGEFADKILLSKTAIRNSSFIIMAYADVASDVLRSKLKIDACHRLHKEMYGHYGNQFRERGTPFFSTTRNAEFQHLQDGDRLKIDLRTGSFQSYPRQNKFFNIADLVQTVKNAKSK